MSNARNRKRRHSTAFSEQPINGEQDAEPKEDTPPVDGDNAQSSNGVVLDEEQEELIRNAVREEHVESLDQLAHTTRRKMSLIREVDLNEQEFSRQLQDSMQQYYLTRQALAQRRLPKENYVALDNSHPPDTRALLARIASLMEDRVRCGEEKVNLAQTMQETIERQIRLLEYYISDQENAIRSESSHGTILPPISMPDKWIRHIHTAVSPISDEEPEVPPEQAPNNSGALKITVPGVARTIQGPELPSDDVPDAPKPKITLYIPQSGVDEPKYCICQQVSFGEMIGCDNMACKIEWFHIGCVGLTEAPTSVKWYCDDCRKGRFTSSNGGGANRKRAGKRKRKADEAYR
ncbi:hypothetical protein CPB85DRAFT_1276791 [Mucidula mucida]|nr:hypothetical protein CPB85DRAFT_1276791 [Mucidula mucida]